MRKLTIEERYDLGELVTFKLNKHKPRHRWFFLQGRFLEQVR
ncbi:MAG: hypothetical protein QXX19_01385 [Candidatus Caldarchaeum sp.]